MAQISFARPRPRDRVENAGDLREPRIDEDRFQVALTFETGPAGVHGFGITLRDAAYTAEYQAYERYERPDQPALREPETLLPELFLETGQEMYFEM